MRSKLIADKYKCLEIPTLELEIKSNFERDPCIYLTNGDIHKIKNTLDFLKEEIKPGVIFTCNDGTSVEIYYKSLILNKKSGGILHFEGI